jgi:hypothetical protein
MIAKDREKYLRLAEDAFCGMVMGKNAPLKACGAYPVLTEKLQQAQSKSIQTG